MDEVGTAYAYQLKKQDDVYLPRYYLYSISPPSLLVSPDDEFFYNRCEFFMFHSFEMS